ncbi:MAG TPA: hypothetical protein VH912_24165 [Streptosporangiaceae bacterium]|jgi:hypothetical protein
MTEPTDTSPDSEQETMHDVSDPDGGAQDVQDGPTVADPVQAAKDARAQRYGDDSGTGDTQTDDEQDDEDQDDSADEGGAGGQ